MSDTSEPDFYGPWLKVERAEKHLRNLEDIMDRYVQTNVKRMRPRGNQHGLVARKRTLGHALPKHTVTILGDAIHNFRSSLDHAYCELVKANGGTINRYVKFPFFDQRQALESSIKGQEKLGLTPHPQVLSAIINRIQPYEGGALELYNVHALDITDKHTLLIPLTVDMVIDELAELDPNGVPTGGGFSNLRLVNEYGPRPFRDGHIGLHGGYGMKLKGDPKEVFVANFGPETPFYGESVLVVMKRVSDATRRALNILEESAGLSPTV